MDTQSFLKVINPFLHLRLFQTHIGLPIIFSVTFILAGCDSSEERQSFSSTSSKPIEKIDVEMTRDDSIYPAPNANKIP